MNIIFHFIVYFYSFKIAKQTTFKITRMYQSRLLWRTFVTSLFYFSGGGGEGGSENKRTFYTTVCTHIFLRVKSTFVKDYLPLYTLSFFSFLPPFMLDCAPTKISTSTHRHYIRLYTTFMRDIPEKWKNFGFFYSIPTINTNNVVRYCLVHCCGKTIFFLFSSPNYGT